MNAITKKKHQVVKAKVKKVVKKERKKKGEESKSNNCPYKISGNN